MWRYAGNKVTGQKKKRERNWDGMATVTFWIRSKIIKSE